MARSRKETTISIRKLIIFHHSSGKEVRNVSKLVNLYHSTEQYVIKRFKEENRIENKYVSAELPDPIADPTLFQIITRCMIHGPSGTLNSNLPCMREVYFHKKEYVLKNELVIANSLRKQFEPNNNPIPTVSEKVKEAVENFFNTPHINNPSPVTASVVIDFIKTLKPNKSSGLDQISNRMLKNLPLKFILYLTFLMNVLMQNCYFPNCWKTAVVLPIPKPNYDLSLPQNYRPISLLSCLSQVFESVLLKRLNQFLDDNNIIISEQFGFRENLSTNHQFVRATELIHDGFEKSKTTGELFLDVAKTFDKIWYDGLFLKLIRLCVSAQLIKIFLSHLTSRNFQVRVNHIISSPHPILGGCGEGSLISPTLFDIYVNDIPNTYSCHLAIFADDTVILTQHKNPYTVIKHLQHYVSQLQLWLVDWKIKVNPNINVRASCLPGNIHS
ncbi:putative RNA-directed DNA polymerase from transposon BS [Araneus ventricosus]|uniref:Putative RNA-directed DNA polymerase from transposon BS n=1 Tax=Araneus ventricosus TaxID=182803 RepID=A0A4Y2GMY7_ARAVE|nr:putative RNA-directed DNA polymerase from transposon BS [Araneus ventricosus]